MSQDRRSSAAEEGRLNEAEAKLGPEMSTSELASHFNEPTPTAKPEVIPKTKEELDKWEKDQLNSNDIYRIAARVKNLAAGNGSLTPVGEMMCNSFVHVLKAIYDFSETLPEPQKTQLGDLLRKHEDMPANLIAAAGAGVRNKK